MKTRYTPDRWDQAPISPRQTRASLLALVLVLALAAVFLHRAFGWPLPVAWPAWAHVAATLTGSDLPPAVVRALVGLGAWLVWGWLAMTIVVQLTLAALEVVTRGAKWVRRVRRLVDVLTLPLVRRLVHGALVTVTVAELTTRTIPLVAAASPHALPTPTHAPIHAARSAQLPTTSHTPAAPSSSPVTYVVQPGDGLWTVAQRCYGDGERWPEILAANVGRRMPDGQVFTRAPVLQPGWVLLVPHATAPQAVPKASTSYVVQRDDTLSGIAERFYHDARLWPRIFQANRGAHLGRTYTLTDPNRIWPGMVLRVPGVAPASQTTPSSPMPSGALGTSGAQPTNLPPPLAPLLPDHDSHPPAPVPAQEQHAPAPPSPPEHAYPPVPALDPLPGAPSVTTRPVQPSTATHTPPAHRPLAAEEALLAGGAVMAAVGAVIVGRRVRWRRFGEPPEVIDPGTPLEDGYATAQLASAVAHRLDVGESEPAVELAEAVRRFLAQHAIEDAAILAAEQPRRGSPMVLLGAELAAQDRLLLLGEAMGAALGGEAVVTLTAERDVRVRPRRRHQLRIVPPAPDDAPLPLVPLAVLPDGATWYGNWVELGHVLVAGTPMGGATVALTSLVAGLAARCHPRDLVLWTLARPHDLPEPLGQLPHQARSPADLGDSLAVQAALAALEEELDRRLASGVTTPRLVVVVSELGDLPDDATWERVVRSGPECGMQLLAATRRPDELPANRLGWFPSRLALGLEDAELGVRLVGTPWVWNGRGGHVAIQLAGRAPRDAYAFRVADDHLRELVALLVEAAGRGRPQPAPVPPAAPDDGDSLPEPEESIIESSVAAAGAPVSSKPPRVADLLTRTGGVDDAAVEARATAVIDVRCLGTFRVSRDGRALAAGTSLVAQKMWGLLAYLAAHPVEGVPKDRLLAAFWPGEEEDAATKALRSMMTRLRTALSGRPTEGRDDLMHLERDGTCRLEPQLVRSDVHAFLGACRAAERSAGAEAQVLWEQARALYEGDLFADGAGAEVAWAEERSRGLSLREDLRGEYFAATHQLALLLRRAGDSHAAAALYEAMLRLQPDFEDAAQRLYRCYQDLGDRASVVRAHHRLARVLAEEFEAEPEPETVRVYRAVLAALDATASSTVGVPDVVDVSGE